MLSGGEHCTCLHVFWLQWVGKPLHTRPDCHPTSADKRRQPIDKRIHNRHIWMFIFYLKHYQRQIAISTANNICSLIRSLGQATLSTFAVIFILGLAQLGG